VSCDDVILVSAGKIRKVWDSVRELFSSLCEGRLERTVLRLALLLYQSFIYSLTDIPVSCLKNIKICIKIAPTFFSVIVIPSSASVLICAYFSKHKLIRKHKLMRSLMMVLLKHRNMSELF